MKLRSLAVGILFAGILSFPAFSQNAAEPQGQGEHHRRGKGDPAAMAARGQARVDQQMERLTKELTLSQDQQDKIRKLISDHQEQMGQQMRTQMTPENRVKMRDLMKQIDGARAAGDTEKVNALEAQRRELMGESQMETARQKLMTDIEAVLTADQKTKFQQIKDDVFGRRIPLEEHPELLLKAVESLKLSADKEQKIKGIIDEWTTKYQNQRSKDRTAPKDRTALRDRMASKDRTAARADAAEVYKKVMGELTPEQQAKVQAWRPESMAGRWRGEGQGEDQGAGKGHRGHKHGGGQDANAPAAQPNQ